MELIHCYTREQAIQDGFLVDLSKLAKEAGFKFPVALTHAAYEAYGAWDEADNQRKGTFQDTTGRIWDILIMARFKAKRTSGSEFLFQFLCVPKDGLEISPQEVTLKAVCGPGNNLEPVITIMMPEED